MKTFPAIIVIALLPFCLTGAEMRVGTEYRYPTDYTVQPIMGTRPGGTMGVVGGIVEPSGFETRFVGVYMYVEAYVGHLSGSDGMVVGNVIVNGNTKLMMAATQGDQKSVKKMLFAEKGTINKRNRFGSTALMGASAGGYENIVRSLLRAGADAKNVSDNGSTALMFAAKNGHDKVVKMLLAGEAQVNKADAKGMTALMYAVQGGYGDVVSGLVKKGADINAADGQGSTPLMIASRQDDRQIVVLLTKLGAKK